MDWMSIWYAAYIFSYVHETGYQFHKHSNVLV